VLREDPPPISLSLPLDLPLDAAGSGTKEDRWTREDRGRRSEERGEMREEGGAG